MEQIISRHRMPGSASNALLVREKSGLKGKTVLCHTPLSSPFPDAASLVRTLALRVLARLPKGAGMEMSDLIQAGNVGLLQASQAFRREGSVPLLGYARFRVRGEMLDAVRRHIGRGCRPSFANARTGPKDSANSAEFENLMDRLPAPPEKTPLRLLAAKQRDAILLQEVGRLPPRYRTVVRLRYSGDCSLREIGSILQVNESRACQIHKSALIRLRRALSARGVHDFW